MLKFKLVYANKRGPWLLAYDIHASGLICFLILSMNMCFGITKNTK